MFGASPSPTARATRIALVVLLAVSASACGRFSRHTAGPLPTPTPQDYGKGLSFSPSAKPSEGKKGTLIIYLVGETDGRGVPGATIAYDGPETGTMVTDAGGKATAKVRAGSYEVSVPRCGRTVLVNTAATASARVVAGHPAGGTLTPVAWEPRFTPSPSVRVSRTPPWKKGSRVTLGVRIEDGCNFTAAPNTSIAGYSWKVTGAFGVAAQPTMRSNGEGFAQITVTCRTAGDGEIEIVSRTDPSDAVNLLDASSAPTDGRDWCVR